MIFRPQLSSVHQPQSPRFSIFSHNLSEVLTFRLEKTGRGIKVYGYKFFVFISCKSRETEWARDVKWEREKQYNAKLVIYQFQFICTAISSYRTRYFIFRFFINTRKELNRKMSSFTEIVTKSKHKTPAKHKIQFHKASLSI